MGESQFRSRILASTPADSNCFIGFHDIIPWSQDGSRLAIHRTNPAFCEMNHCSEPIEICLWHPENGQIEAVDTTTAWNYQQGSRLQWLPGHSDIIVFNSIENGRPVSVYRNVATRERRVVQAPIYAFSPDGKTSIAPNFTTLAHRWKAYGYPRLEKHPLIEDPDADGLWLVDVASGNQRLFISTGRVAEYLPLPTQDYSKHFLCHATFSPDGLHIVFLHRYFHPDGGLISRMFVTDRDGKDLTMLAQEKVSHFDWLDEDSILVWARFASGLAQVRSRGLFKSPLLAPFVRAARNFKGRWKQKLLSEAYYAISISDPKSRRRFGWPNLEWDGHPMVARSHHWIVTDYYPSNQYAPVFLYNTHSSACLNVHTFQYNPRSLDSDVKCDLHPRWNRSERLIAVDTCESGYRQVRIVDVEDVVKA